MDSWTKSVVTLLILMVFSEHTESKGLCEFAAMFPSLEVFTNANDGLGSQPITGCPLSTGESYVNLDCSVKCTCVDGQPNCDKTYSCSPHAECRLLGDGAQCYCNEGYEGDGETCNPLPKDCYDAYQAGHRDDGVYTILPSGWPGSPFNVSCVMSTNGGGWTVFQRRVEDGETDFYQNWTSYRYGFGSLDKDFWLGNEQLYYLTNQRNYKLRIEFLTFVDSLKYAEYSSFRINGSDHQFLVDIIEGFDGSTENGMGSTQGRGFSTYDKDNDGCETHACAEKHRGGWWYASDWCDTCRQSECSNFQLNNSCYGECSYSNLNGEYNGGNGEKIFWSDYHECDITHVEMKIKPS